MIVTFYSFKGGVGRSMAMANIARSFQLRGLNVVMVDWDLEAPGLETFFSSDPELLRSWRDRVGLMDLLMLYRQDYPAIPFSTPRQAPEPPGPDPEVPNETRLTDGHAVPVAARSPEERWNEVMEDAARLRELLPPLKFSLIDVPAPPSANGAGRLRMLTAGWREGARFATYANAVQSFDWNDFYASFHGHAYFEWIRGSLDDPEVADIVLIDSRTGVTEMGGVSTRQLADVVVVLMAPNRQNIEGAIQISESFSRAELLEQRGNRPIQVVMVPSRVDVSATDVKKEFEDDFKERANGFMPDSLRQLERDFWDLRIPYVSKYAFRERLSIGERDGDPDLDAAYRAISAHIAWLAPDASRTKSAMVDDFERVFGRERVRRALDFGAQFNQRWSEVPDELRRDVREVLLRLVDVRPSASTTERDRVRVLLQDHLQAAFPDGVTIAERSRLVVRVPAEDGKPALRLAEDEYVTRSVLAKWIDEDRDFLAWRQRLRFFLEDWRRNGRDRGSLLQGAALVEAAEMADTAERFELLDDEREFIEASIAAARATPVETPVVSPASAAGPWTGAPPAYSTPPPPAPSDAVSRTAPPAKRSAVPIVGAVTVLLVVAAAAWLLMSSESAGNVESRAVADSLLAGRRHFADSNYANAIAAYTFALGVDSASVEARRLRADAQVAAGHPELALPDLDTALALAPADVRLRARRAQLRVSVADDTAAALEDLGRIPVDSMDIATLRLRADLYDGQRQDSAALAAYTAVVQSGDTAAGQLGRGRVLERIGRKDDAVRAYRVATSATSDPSIVTFAQTRLRLLAPGTTVTPPPSSRIYLQYLSAADTVFTAAIDSSLQRVALRLERDSRGRRHEVVRVGKTPGEVRYFRPADEGLARRVQVAVEGALAAQGIYQRLRTQITRLPSEQRPQVRQAGLVEIWLPPLNAPTQTQQTAPRPSIRPR